MIIDFVVLDELCLLVYSMLLDLTFVVRCAWVCDCLLVFMRYGLVLPGSFGFVFGYGLFWVGSMVRTVGGVLWCFGFLFRWVFYKSLYWNAGLLRVCSR